jgi:hypothetical protein
MQACCDSLPCRSAVCRRHARGLALPLALALVLLATSPAPAREGQPAATSDDELVRLYGEYIDAAPDSKEEATAFEALRARLPDEKANALQQMSAIHRKLLEKRLGGEVVAAHRAYLEARSGSAEEAAALGSLRSTIEERGLPFDRTMQLLAMSERLDEAASGDAAAAQLRSPDPSTLDILGPQKALEPVDVEMVLTVSRPTVVAGDQWAVIGSITNRSDRPVWIANNYTTLLPAPEVWGGVAAGGSLGAFFPSTGKTAGDEVIRIEPRGSYTVVWDIDHLKSYNRAYRTQGGGQERPGPLSQLMQRIRLAWSGYMFFVPGEYQLFAILHVWPTHPKLTNASISNLGDSVTRTASLKVRLDASPWVLIFGASLGGLLCFALQTTQELRSGTSLWRLRTLGFFTLGVGTALLLTSIVTILISRLATTQFLISVEVRDFWGAVATGFVVQWFGYPLISRLLPTELHEQQHEPAPPDDAPQASVANGGARPGRPAHPRDGDEAAATS